MKGRVEIQVEDDKVAVWSQVRETLVDCIVRRCEALAAAAEAKGERFGASFQMSIEVDVLVPWDTMPSISLMESKQICAVSMGMRHWDFIATGMFSFVRTTMQKIEERVPASMSIMHGAEALNQSGGGVSWYFCVAPKFHDVIYSVGGGGK